MFHMVLNTLLFMAIISWLIFRKLYENSLKCFFKTKCVQKSSSLPPNEALMISAKAAFTLPYISDVIPLLVN